VITYELRADGKLPVPVILDWDFIAEGEGLFICLRDRSSELEIEYDRRFLEKVRAPCVP